MGELMRMKRLKRSFIMAVIGILTEIVDHYLWAINIGVFKPDINASAMLW
jgi:hypothetical protein